MKQVLDRIRRYHPSAAVYLFGAVLLLRFWALARLTTSPFLLPAKGDMHFYNDWALRILHGASDHQAFYGLPGYAWLLAGIYALFGYSPFLPGFLQALLESGTAVLIYQLTVLVFESPKRDSSARKFDARWIATAAGLGWGLCQPAQAYSIVLMPTSWLIFVFWFVVWQCAKRNEPLSPLAGLGLGLLIGLTATGIATVLFLVPLVAVAIFRKSRKTVGHALVACALVVLGLLGGSSPCWFHNYFVAHDPVFLSAHSGINFWIGNNPDATGYPKFPPGLRAGQAAMLQDSISVAETAVGHPLKHGEVSAYWSNKARQYIREHPAAWIGLLVLKLRNFWSAFRYDDLSIMTTLREEGIILPGLNFGLIAALALPGILLGLVRFPKSRWVGAAILLHMAALLPVFVTERYRLPIVPGLLVFDAISLAWFWRTIALAEWKPALAYAGLFQSKYVTVRAAIVNMCLPDIARARSATLMDSSKRPKA